MTKYFILDEKDNPTEVSDKAWENGIKEKSGFMQEDVNGYMVATILLHPSKTYETRVFKRDEKGKINYLEEDIDSYNTPEHTLIGHQLMVKKWESKNG